MINLLARVRYVVAGQVVVVAAHQKTQATPVEEIISVRMLNRIIMLQR